MRARAGMHWCCNCELVNRSSAVRLAERLFAKTVNIACIPSIVLDAVLQECICRSEKDKNAQKLVCEIIEELTERHLLSNQTEKTI